MGNSRTETEISQTTRWQELVASRVFGAVVVAAITIYAASGYLNGHIDWPKFDSDFAILAVGAFAQLVLAGAVYFQIRAARDAVTAAGEAAEEASEATALAHESLEQMRSTVEVLRSQVEATEALAIHTGEMAAAHVEATAIARRQYDAVNTPNFYIRASQRSSGNGSALTFVLEQGQILAREVWCCGYADGKDTGAEMTPTSDGDALTHSMDISGPMRSVKIQLTFLGPTGQRFFREAHISFHSMGKRGIPNAPGEAFIEMPNWDWIHTDSGLAWKALH